MARDLHMTVAMMLKNMTQKELCYWIAYHNLENQEYDEKKEQGRQKVENVKTASAPRKSVTQKQKDAAMLSQLLALAGQKND